MVRFVKVLGYANVVGRILDFVNKRMNETLIVGVLGLTALIGQGFYIYVRMDKQIDVIQCFFYAFLGIIGGDF